MNTAFVCLKKQDIKAETRCFENRLRSTYLPVPESVNRAKRFVCGYQHMIIRDVWSAGAGAIHNLSERIKSSLLTIMDGWMMQVSQNVLLSFDLLIDGLKALVRRHRHVV